MGWGKLLVGGLTLGVLWTIVHAYLGFPVTQICQNSHETGQQYCVPHYAVTVPFFWMASFVEAHDGAIVAIFTAFLAWSTVGLWSATKRLAEGAEKQTADMKESIELAQKQFIATHRPKVEVLHLEAASETKDGAINIGAIGHYANVGTSVARHITINGKITTLTTLSAGIELPELRANRADRESGVKGEFLIQSDISLEDHKAKFTQDKLVMAPHQVPRVYCIGKVVYEDVKGAKRETGFCRIWIPSDERWARIDNPEYEYSF